MAVTRSRAKFKMESFSNIKTEPGIDDSNNNQVITIAKVSKRKRERKVIKIEKQADFSLDDGLSGKSERSKYFAETIQIKTESVEDLPGKSNKKIKQTIKDETTLLSLNHEQKISDGKKEVHGDKVKNSKKIQTKSEPFSQPTNWQATIENIKGVRSKYPAPVDTMGCDQASSPNDIGRDRRFQILISLMLSSQTKDPITWAAVQKLKEDGCGNVDGLLGKTEKEIESLIYPVGFYHRKAIYLKKVAQILKDDYNSDIPNTLESLCKLPGVGPKMAHLCMLEAWNILSGIGVDTHVHRIAQRLQWVPKKTKTPEDTRKALESWLPREHWAEINHMLVGFGQTICTPLRPKCSLCLNNRICPAASADLF